LFGGRFSKAASARYQITGSWDKPVMTLIEKRDIDAPPAAPLLNPAGAAGSTTPAASRSAGR
jgi:hypothetical protein